MILKLNKINLMNLDSETKRTSSNDENDEATITNTTNVFRMGESGGNLGWADSISKVLNTTKPKSKKNLILSRAKNLNKNNVGDDVIKKDYNFEIEGEIKEVIKPEKLDLKLKEPKIEKNKKLLLRTKPSNQDKERERALRRISTKGVVQLFNAVRMQQKDLNEQLEDAGPLDSRKEAVLQNINKRKFLDVLMSGKRSKSEKIDNPIKKEKLKKEDKSSDDEDKYSSDGDKMSKSEWGVFKDDFMTNKKFANWDQEGSSSEDNKEETDDENLD